jgi:hypothetical protein
LCFRKVTQKIFSKLDETKNKHPDIKQSFQNSEEEMEGSHGVATPPGGAANPWPAPPCGKGPWPTSGAAPSPIKTPRREKPKYPINFPETHHDPPPSSTRDREGLEALPGTLPVAPCLIKRQNSCVSVPFARSVDSTTVQNIVIIAIASII